MYIGSLLVSLGRSICLDNDMTYRGRIFREEVHMWTVNLLVHRYRIGQLNMYSVKFGEIQVEIYILRELPYY